MTTKNLPFHEHWYLENSLNNCTDVFEGVNEIFEKAFAFPQFGKTPQFDTRAAQNHLKREGYEAFRFGRETLAAALQQIKSNYDRRTRDKIPSTENWRLQKDCDYKTLSHEVSLERTIVSVGDNWFNQIPTSSGLVDADGNKRANIDLAKKNSEGDFDFLELKWNRSTNNAVYATVEILRYALVYLFSVENGQAFGYLDEGRNTELIQASNVRLQVLAPKDYYEVDGEITYLSKLQQLSNDAISGLSDQLNGPKMSLHYLVFPNGFDWDPTLEETKRKDLVRSALSGIALLL